MTIIKYIKRQDSGWKQAPGYSGETSINLSREIFEFLTFGMVDCGEVSGITVRIYKVDFLNALATLSPIAKVTPFSSHETAHL